MVRGWTVALWLWGGAVVPASAVAWKEHEAATGLSPSPCMDDDGEWPEEEDEGVLYTSAEPLRARYEPGVLEEIAGVISSGSR